MSGSELITPDLSAQQRLRTERLIAWTRAPLVLACLAAVYLDPTEPRQYVSTAYAVLSAYTLYTFGVAVWLASRSGVRPWFGRWSVIVDVIVCGLLVAMTAGPGSPLFPLFTYLLAAAAFRGGPMAVMGAAVVLPVFFVAGAIWTLSVNEGPALPLNFFIIRIAYIFAIAILLGYLSHAERLLRREATVVARALARIRDARTYMASLAVSADEFASVYSPRSVIMLVQDRETQRYGWSFTFEPEAEGLPRAESVPDDLLAEMWVDLPEEVTAWDCRRANHAVTTVTPSLSVAGEQIPAAPAIPESVWNALRASRIVGFQTPLSNWDTRVYVLDPRTSTAPDAALRLFYALASQLAPALLNMYLVRRIRRNAAVIERGRLARELHDRVLQSLIGIEMQLAGTRKMGDASDAVLAHISQVRDTLRSEIAAARELMNELQPLELRSDELVPYLRNLVERFRRDTEIAVQFVADAPVVELSPRRCGELARIVQEALVNIRKHSGATEAQVSLVHARGGLTFRVEDNGKGFPFEGTFTDDELRRSHRGPIVIQQRARRIGGSLTLASRRGGGSRLEVVLRHA